MRRRNSNRVAQRISVCVRAGKAYWERSIFRCRKILTYCYRRVVNRADGDVYRRRQGVARAIIRREKNPIRSGVIARWRVDKVRRNATQRAVLGRRDDEEGKRITIHIAGGEGDLHGYFFIGRFGLGRGKRQIVHRLNGERDSRRRGIDDAVISLKGKRILAIEVRRGRISKVWRGAAQ